MTETTVRRTIVEDAYFHVENGGAHTGLLEQITTTAEGAEHRTLQLIYGYSHFGIVTDQSMPLLNVEHISYFMGILAKAKTMMETRPDQFRDHARADVRPRLGVTGGLRVEDKWEPISGSDRESLVGHAFYDQITGEQIKFIAWEGAPLERGGAISSGEVFHVPV